MRAAPLIAALAATVISLTARGGQPPPFPGATNDYKSWTLAHLPGSPEGLAVDAQGRMFTALSDTGEILRLDEHGGYSHVATVPNAELGRAGHTWGLEFDSRGYLYAAYVWKSRFYDENDPLHLACRDSTDQFTGIYRIDVATGTVTAVLTKHDGWPVCFPDDIAVDSHGNLYVTDLTLSGIWKIAPDRSFNLWSAHALLQWPPDPYNPIPEGANDLVLDPTERSLYVVTDGDPAIIGIPIGADGSAGTPHVIARDLSPLDGVAVDPEGNIYVSEILRSEISVFSPDGAQRVVIATSQTAPLVNPTSLVYRRGTVCAANLGWNVTPEPRSIACISGFRRPEAAAQPTRASP
ncbi:MAG TPA: SMP-30/gluconolactonase/LRE family protein [Steroidobacteraceae bacterium]|nr:SMP-30/gluconolactonase/LRE family protein [Steroidobacteraceae bacterium]